jgi:3-deoxy-D-manno-octulosonic-acid transferase
LARESLAGISVIAAQTAEHAERFIGLGAKNVVVTGSMKFDVTPPVAQVELAQTLRQLYGEGRPVLLAASTREGEEELILDELDNIEVPSVLTVIVPRHPRRFAAVAGLIEQRGIKLQKRSAQAPIAPDTRVVLGDSMGEMFAYYGACDVAFIGGSLRPFGAHNLIEACAMGKPVLIGPSVYNFPEPVRHAVEAGVAIQVRNERALAKEATRLLLDPATAMRMGRDAAALCEAHRGATARIMELIRLVPNR